MDLPVLRHSPPLRSSLHLPLLHPVQSGDPIVHPQCAEKNVPPLASLYVEGRPVCVCVCVCVCVYVCVLVCYLTLKQHMQFTMIEQLFLTSRGTKSFLVTPCC